MKIRSKWKSLKPDMKAGLVTSTIYLVTTFGLPAYAAVNSEEQQTKVFNPTNIEQIITFEQANDVYNQKLKEYTSDKELDYHEAKDLLGIISKGKEILDDKKPENLDKYFEAKDKIDEISNQREILEQNLDKIKEPDNFFLDYLIEKKVEIKEKISAEYPGILDKSDSNLNITYPADIEINTANLQTLIKDTAKEINSKLMMRYNDSSLNGVANTSRDSLELKHIAKLIKVIEIYELKLISAKKVGGTDIALKNNIKKLKSEEETIWKSNLGAEEKKLFEEYLENNSDVLSKSRLFSEYVVYKHKADDYLEKFGDKNRYWSDSIFAEIRREMQEGYKDLDAFLDDDNKNLVQDSLNDYLKSEGLEAKVADMKNPSNLKFNLLWCLLGNALLFPIIRNFMVKKYVDDNPDGEDYFGSFMAAVGSWGVGCAITDGLHPLAYWVRMASPLVIQPVRKLLKGKDGY